MTIRGRGMGRVQVWACAASALALSLSGVGCATDGAPDLKVDGDVERASERALAPVAAADLADEGDPARPLPLADLPPEPVTCTPVRYDLRRQARSCEDLPGAYVDGGVTWAGASRGGRFRVARLLDTSFAPEELKRRACSYVWEPRGCTAPDVRKLLVTTKETLMRRPDACLASGAQCRVAAARITGTGPRLIPNGPGRCEVCGYASGRVLWAVLPPDYLSYPAFAYELAGQPRAYVATDAVELDGVTVFAVPLPVSVPEQDVSLLPSNL